MSLEAAAGKNPTAHVGKIYNVLATLMARDIDERIEEVNEVAVTLLSAIGEPIDEPQVAAIEISSKHGLSGGLKKAVAEIADGWLERSGHVTQLILEGRAALY